MSKRRIDSEPEIDQVDAPEAADPTAIPGEAAGDQAAETEVPAAPDPAPGRQTAAPGCPYHPGTRCKSKNSTPYFTRYYCPIAGCTFMVKQPRPGLRRRIEKEAEEDFSAR